MKTFSNGKTLLGALAACAVLATLAAPARAQRAHVDPATGALATPSTDQRQRLESAVRKARAARKALRTAPLQAVRLPDGSQGVAHDASTLNYTLVRVAADGSLRTECVPGEQAARRLAGLPAPADRSTASAFSTPSTSSVMEPSHAHSHEH